LIFAYSYDRNQPKINSSTPSAAKPTATGYPPRAANFQPRVSSWTLENSHEWYIRHVECYVPLGLNIHTKLFPFPARCDSPLELCAMSRYRNVNYVFDADRTSKTLCQHDLVGTAVEKPKAAPFTCRDINSALLSHLHLHPIENHLPSQTELHTSTKACLRAKDTQ
jgi:hypothetical protein